MGSKNGCAFERVLVTGTTSGLGKAFLEHYASLGCEIVAVNRRSDSALEARFSSAKFYRIDIGNYQEVLGLMDSFSEKNRPQLLILNAGINRIDNSDGLDFPVFELTMSTNLNGVMSFVGAIHELGWSGVTVASISSTSNLIPNPAHISYHLSKWSLQRSFRLLGSRDLQNEYKTVVLGPVHTNIASNYGGPEGFNRKIFDWLAITPEQAAKRCSSFFQGRAKLLTFPTVAAWFYRAVRVLLCFCPWLYSGTKPTQIPTYCPTKSS